MVDTLQLDKKVIDKDQINRILDIESDSQPSAKSKQTIYILNGGFYELSQDMTADQCLELAKVNKNARKRTHSNEADDQSDYSGGKYLFGKKDVICIDRQDGDSLQKLALTFNCTIAEIKYANKIYNEQELHALRTVKVPVVKDGSLYHMYTKSKNNLSAECGNKEESSSCSDEYINKSKPSVQNVIAPQLCYISDLETDCESTEKEHLLVDKTVLFNNLHSCHPVNVCDSTLPDFMNKMDEKIKKDIQEIEIKNDNLVEVVNALDKQIEFYQRRKTSYENTVSLCSFSWKHLVLLIILLAVVIPIIYFIYFLKNRNN